MDTMYLVAIAEIQGEEGATLGPLAAELGTTAYELRLVLNAGVPAVVLATVDAAQARAAEAAIARHGHSPILCDRGEVVSSGRMTLLRDFAFRSDGLLAQQTADSRLVYDDVAALLRATHRTTSETTEQVKERAFRPGMAIMTGGLVMSKTTKKTVTTTTAHNEQVLYIFHRGFGPPWLLKERTAQYGGLGVRLGATSFENFGTTLRWLRERCPRAAYDERLKTSRPLRGVADGVEATDIYAHLLASWMMSGSLSVRS